MLAYACFYIIDIQMGRDVPEIPGFKVIYEIIPPTPLCPAGS